MNYKKLYQQLIGKAVFRGVISPAERHHVIPRSMGGSNNKDNIVYFTPREHFIAHLLLWKIHRNIPMSHALWMMCNTRDNIRMNGKQYEVFRLEHSLNVSKILSGRKLSEEHKEKVRQANIGKRYSQEIKDKISLGNIGKPGSRTGQKCTAETKEKMSISHKGKPGTFTGKKHSSETKEKMKGVKKPQQIVECPHCGKVGGNSGMKNHHFDNCKSLTL